MYTWLKLGIGLTLLGSMLVIVDAGEVLRSVVYSSPGWFVVALIFAIISNLICAHRWRAIACRMHASMTYRGSLTIYGQALAANSVLPGGIIGGDLWRATRLSQYTPTGYKDAGPASVFVDRASGLWGLAWVSLVGGGLWVATAPPLGERVQGYFLIQFCALTLILVAPFALSRLARPSISRLLTLFKMRFLRSALQMLLKVATATPLLIRMLPHSIGAQFFTQLALWSCLRAVGLDIPALLLIGVSSSIILASVIPTAVGGFGPRELGTAAFLSPFGYPPEALIAGSVLFGLTATIQGALSLAFFGSPEPIDLPPPQDRRK